MTAIQTFQSKPQQIVKRRHVQDTCLVGLVGQLVFHSSMYGELSVDMSLFDIPFLWASAFMYRYYYKIQVNYYSSIFYPHRFNGLFFEDILLYIHLSKCSRKIFNSHEKPRVILKYIDNMIQIYLYKSVILHGPIVFSPAVPHDLVTDSLAIVWALPRCIPFLSFILQKKVEK